MSFLHTYTARKAVVALAIALMLGVMALPSYAQDLSEEIRELKEEQEQVKAQKEAKAKDIEVATATVEELTDALAVLTAQVNEQETKLDAARTQLMLAEARYTEATAAVQEKKAEIEALKIQVQAQAISAFVGAQDTHPNPVLDDVDPNEAVRRRSLVLSVTRRDIDLGEQLKDAQDELAIQQALADEAAKEAEEYRAAIEADLIQLQAAEDRQAELAAAAEARLEARLAEQAILEEMESQLAGEIKEKNDELARQAALAAARRRSQASASVGNIRYPSADQIVKVQTFWVHEDIASDLNRLLNDARAAGIEFGGWGYRDHQRQIELRRAHCGSSNYAIWQMSSSRCRPPTARPGFSQHEQGKAIDFTYNGRSIGSRSSPGYKWLAANAHKYGLYNLPSEPWHWSVNGN
jgi:LAS superfamily LD-carboxypeptidase LdcB